jgi:anti-sigma B factor antagonist
MLKVAKEDGRYLVSLFQVNKLNTLFSELIKQQLSTLVSEPGRVVIFNLEGVRFIDSAGFATLLCASEIAKAKKAEFKICNVSEEVMELIELTELQNVLPICSFEPAKEKIIMELDD